MKQWLSNPWLQGGVFLAVAVLGLMLLPTKVEQGIVDGICLIGALVLVVRKDRPRDRGLPAGFITSLTIIACWLTWNHLVTTTLPVFVAGAAVVLIYLIWLGLAIWLATRKGG